MSPNVFSSTGPRLISGCTAADYRGQRMLAAMTRAVRRIRGGPEPGGGDLEALENLRQTSSS